MATDVVVDVRTDGLKTSGATSLAWNATITGGLTNSVLIGLGTTGSSTAKRISTFQWDAAGTPVALTNLTFRIDGGSNCYAEVWYLNAPASGTKQVKITPTASCEITGGSASYQFVNQTTPWNASSPQTNTGTAIATQPNLTLTSANHEMGVTCALENSSGSSITGISTSAGQTQIFNETVGATSHAGVGSDKLSTGATVALSYTGVQNGNPWVCVGGSLQFDGGGGGGGRTFRISSGLDGLSTSGPKQFNPTL